jgi:hypothetical protein
MGVSPNTNSRLMAMVQKVLTGFYALIAIVRIFAKTAKILACALTFASQKTLKNPFALCFAPMPVERK